MIRHRFIITIGLVFCCSVSYAGPQSTTKEIFAKNKAAIVKIFVNEEFSGTGFIISKDGLIVTANHVVTTRESGYLTYGKNITVYIARDNRSHVATPVILDTTETKRRDLALIRIQPTDLPTVTLGSMAEITEADEITVIGHLHKPNLLFVVNGIVSAREPTAPQRILIFQAPVRGGFSGAPVFSNTTGNVIGVVNTKVFGISQDLDKANETLSQIGGADLQYGNFSFMRTFRELITNLKDGMVSGLGSAIDASHIKELQDQAQKDKK